MHINTWEAVVVVSASLLNLVQNVGFLTWILPPDKINMHQYRSSKSSTQMLSSLEINWIAQYCLSHCPCQIFFQQNPERTIMYISITLTTYDPMTFSFFYFSQHPKLGHDGVIPQGIFEQERGFLIEFHNTTLPPSCSNIPFKC